MRGRARKDFSGSVRNQRELPRRRTEKLLSFPGASQSTNRTPLGVELPLVGIDSDRTLR